MLTKDLLRYSATRGRVRPDFIPVDNDEYLGLAADLIQFYENAQQSRRGEIEENVSDYIRGVHDVKIAKGMNKLLLDRCEFAHRDELDWPEKRARILRRASDLRSRGPLESVRDFRQRVFEDSEPWELYADLPYNEELIKFKQTFPSELLHRYNTALVQGLLFNASEIRLRIREADAANLRRVFKFLRFFRLLARITKEKDTSLAITIDGPMSILSSARKYGLQLATFFPAICLLSDWEMTTNINLKKRSYSLKLDHSLGLQSHYRRLGAYIPEEVQLFAKHFGEVEKYWKLLRETPLIPIEGNEVIFPDFTFGAEDENPVHLELFHRWHKNHLLPRLRSLVTMNEKRFFLGIDRSVLTDEIEQIIDQQNIPSHRFFTFRDYPSVKKVQECLQGFAKCRTEEPSLPLF